MHVARFVRSLVLAAAAGAAVASLTALSVPAAEADTVVVSPGMEIRQDSVVCTLGYVDTVARIASRRATAAAAAW